MLILRLALRHLVRHWRLNLIVLLGRIIGSAFSSSLPMMAPVISGQSHQQTLADASVPERNVELRGEVLSSDQERLIQEIAGGLVDEAEVHAAHVRVFAVDADAQPGNGIGRVHDLRAGHQGQLQELGLLRAGQRPRHQDHGSGQANPLR